VLVAVAVVPEFLLEVLASAFDADQPSTLNGQLHRRGLQVAVLSAEVVACAGVADERAVDGRRRSKNFSGGKIRPIARADEAAGLDPIEAAVEVCGERRAGF